jgi:translocation and assembly module TamB
MAIKVNLTTEGQQVTLVNNNDNNDNNDNKLIVNQADIKIASLPKPAISVQNTKLLLTKKYRRKDPST